MQINNDPKVKLYTQPKLTEGLYRSLPAGIVGLFLVVSTMVWELYGSIATSHLLTWYFSICSIIVFRCGLFIWYKRTRLKPHLHKYHYYLFVIASSLTAVFLGIIGSFLMPVHDIMRQSFVIILVSGVIAGAIQSLSASFVANILYIYLSLIPLLVWQFIQILEGKFIYVGIFISMVIFCIFSFKVARQGYILLTRHIDLEYNYRTLLKRVSDAKEKYKEQAIHDLLTGLYNRQFLNPYIEIEIHKAIRNNSSIGIMMIDIDLLKYFNDNYGHECGDEVLQSFGTVINNTIRKSDVACRYGGDEFIIIMPNTTLEEAKKISEKIRKAIEMITLQRESESIIHMTASFGISTFPGNGKSQEELIAAADKALYQAKQEGRNRICVASEDLF